MYTANNKIYDAVCAVFVCTVASVVRNTVCIDAVNTNNNVVCNTVCIAVFIQFQMYIDNSVVCHRACFG